MWFNILKVNIDFKPLPKNQLGAYYSYTDKIVIDEKNILFTELTGALRISPCST